MSNDVQDRFTLNQVSPDDWVIFDTSLSDATLRLVACVSEHDGFVEVRWFRHVSLPTRFLDRTEALDALRATAVPGRNETADREAALVLH
ncbi:hypothetical protein [Microbacterium sp.]|uniref:hypothetical protein n=1 Tax=Microbacterium sp. TaxID=51671 RepID=UPI002811DFF5|nr:hypothetical protein [Microbacterium sp.]